MVVSMLLVALAQVGGHCDGGAGGASGACVLVVLLLPVGLELPLQLPLLRTSTHC